MAFRISNEAKIGLFAAVAIALLIIGYSYLQGNDVFTRQNVYYAVYTHVEGLAEANPVTVKGLSVGRVTEMEYIPGRDVVVIKFSVSSDIKLPRGTVAQIISADLLGSKALLLQLADNSNFHANNDTVASSVQESLSSSVRAEIAPVKEKAENLLATLDSVVTTVNAVLTPETRDRLVASIKSIQSTLNNLDQSSENLDALLRNNTSRMDRIFANIESISSNIRDNEEQITAMLQNVSAITDSIRRANITQTFNEAKAVLLQTQQIMDKINRGEGSMGLLVNDQKLYNNLDSAAKSLDELLVEMKSNPNRFVHFSIFGRKEKE
ncbi:MAG TPA: MlaD family protein [Chitinophagales bacterium]|nr:MlaD family protein [Chitinophagales bacterium]